MIIDLGLHELERDSLWLLLVISFLNFKFLKGFSSLEYLYQDKRDFELSH